VDLNLLSDLFQIQIPIQPHESFGFRIQLGIQLQK
jgi:hypothetical protein